jgi:hypothetical protein
MGRAVQEELEQDLLGDVLGVLVVAQQAQGEVVDTTGVLATPTARCLAGRAGFTANCSRLSRARAQRE